MIPQRADILPRSVASTEAPPIGKGILLPLDQTGSHLLGIKELAKPLSTAPGEIRDQWTYMAQLTTATRYPYEALLSPFARGGIIGGRDGYGAFDFSLISGARRKNATRETTSPLKAWLHEHRKNPYPTKGEKIMLAILTKMTVTQISTWFANARRRLKKDNKMTWSPRNKSSDKRDSLSRSLKDDSRKSTDSLTDDDDFIESMDTDENVKNDQDSLKEKLDEQMDDDVFAEEDRPICDVERKETLKESPCRQEREEKTAKLSSDTHCEQEGVYKKIDFAGNNSPVGNLQRWVDGHFGNQSPVDFPRELTPPRTPVEDIVSPAIYALKDTHKRKEKTAGLRELEGDKKQDIVLKETKPLEKEREQLKRINNLLEKTELTKFSSSPEEFIRSVASNENGLQSQFRSCGLTSHREIDAVLALTSLASR